MYPRHKLVWLSADGWSGLLAAADATHAAPIRRWAEAGWPLVARRSDADLAAGEVSLGLALPPDPDSGHKVRIALRAQLSGVSNSAPPLLLKDVIDTLPPAWREAAARLEAEAAGLTLRVYGSAALQALTGLPYLRPTSDLDLLFAPATDRQYQSGLALLQKYAGRLPLDGEVVFPRGSAVAWKELAAAGSTDDRVLSKESDTVRLTQLNLLLATLRAA